VGRFRYGYGVQERVVAVGYSILPHKVVNVKFMVGEFEAFYSFDSNIVYFLITYHQTVCSVYLFSVLFGNYVLWLKLHCC